MYKNRTMRDILSFVKNNHYFDIKSILNISISCNYYKDFFKVLLEKFYFFHEIKNIPILQGSWSPYCSTIREDSIEKYSVRFWENFLCKNPDNLTKFELSCIISYFVLKTNLCMKTYGRKSRWFSNIYTNGLIEQLPTSGGFVYNTINDIDFTYRLTISRSFYNNEEEIEIEIELEDQNRNKIDLDIINIDITVINKILSQHFSTKWIDRFNCFIF